MVLLLRIIYVLSVLFCYAFMHVCLLMPCGHLLGKGWPLGSRLWCLIVTLSLSHWYPGSGVVLGCIDSWSLPSFLLSNYWKKQMGCVALQLTAIGQREVIIICSKQMTITWWQTYQLKNVTITLNARTRKLWFYNSKCIYHSKQQFIKEVELNLPVSSSDTITLGYSCNCKLSLQTGPYHRNITL